MSFIKALIRRNYSTGSISSRCCLEVERAKKDCCISQIFLAQYGPINPGTYTMMVAHQKNLVQPLINQEIVIKQVLAEKENEDWHKIDARILCGKSPKDCPSFAIRYVAYLKKEPVGIAQLDLFTLASGVQMGHLTNLGVLESSRKKGVATALVSARIQTALQKGSVVRLVIGRDSDPSKGMVTKILGRKFGFSDCCQFQFLSHVGYIGICNN